MQMTVVTYTAKTTEEINGYLNTDMKNTKLWVENRMSANATKLKSNVNPDLAKHDSPFQNIKETFLQL